MLFLFHREGKLAVDLGKVTEGRKEELEHAMVISAEAGRGMCGGQDCVMLSLAPQAFCFLRGMGFQHSWMLLTKQGGNTGKFMAPQGSGGGTKPDRVQGAFG